MSNLIANKVKKMNVARISLNEDDDVYGSSGMNFNDSDGFSKI